jgi:hypothetical protein
MAGRQSFEFVCWHCGNQSISTFPNQLSAASPKSFDENYARSNYKAKDQLATDGALLSIDVSPARISTGGAGIGTAKLDGKAVAGGLTVLLSSSSAAIATVSSMVVVQPAQKTATFAITPVSVSLSVRVEGLVGSLSAGKTFSVGSF